MDGSAIRTDTPNRLLDLADRSRRAGASDASDAHMFYELCEEAARRGEIRFDRVSAVFKHLMYHTGSIAPAHHERFRICPECEAILNPAEERR